MSGARGPYLAVASELTQGSQDAAANQFSGASRPLAAIKSRARWARLGHRDDARLSHLDNPQTVLGLHTPQTA